MANYFFENVSKHFCIHPAWLWLSPCLSPWLNSIPLLSWQCHAKLRATRGPLLAKWASLGYGSIVLPGARVKPPVTCSNWLMGTALSGTKSARNPDMTRGWATRRHFFMAIIWYGCLSDKPYTIAHTLNLCVLCLPLVPLSHTSTHPQRKLHAHIHLCQTGLFSTGV